MENLITLKDLLKTDPNISVILRRDKLKEMHTLIKLEFRSVERFSRIVVFCNQTLYNWLNGVRNPKLKVVIRICELLNIKLEDIVEKIICFNEPFRSFIPINAFPIKKDANLASLVAHAFGDGHISLSFEYTNKCEDLLNEVCESTRKLSIKNIKVINNRQPYKTPTLVFPKMVRNVLICVGAPRGNKITNEYELPKWIKNGNKEIKCAFISSLFDDEGNVSSGTMRLSLSKRKDLINNLYLFFQDLKLILEELGIRRIKITQQDGEKGKNGETLEYTLVVCGLLNFKTFSEKIKLNHPKKKYCLLSQIENVKVFRTGFGETKEKIIDFVKYDAKTITEIMQQFGICFATTYEHLKDLETKNLVTRIKRNPSKESLWFANNETQKI